MMDAGMVTLRVGALAIVLALKASLLWRLYENRRQYGGQRTTTVAVDRAPFAGHEPERNRVTFLDFGDHLRYSPSSVLSVQNVVIILLVLLVFGPFAVLCWAVANVLHDDGVWAYVVLGLVTASITAWIGRRLLLARRRARSDARLQAVGRRRRVDSFRVQPAGMAGSDVVHAVIARWTDDDGEVWETRCGPLLGDPTAYFHRHPLVVLQDPERTEDSRIDPTFLPLVSWRGAMDTDL